MWDPAEGGSVGAPAEAADPYAGMPEEATAPAEEPMLGRGGTQVTSKTLLINKGQGFRIDVENPAPGVRQGQLHLQTADAKYRYNFDANEFEGLPRSLQRQIARNFNLAREIARAIEKARVILNVP